MCWYLGVCADCRLFGLLNCLVVWFILCGLVAVTGVLDCCVLSIAVMLVCVLRSVGRVTWRSLLCLSFVVSLACVADLVVYCGLVLFCVCCLFLYVKFVVWVWVGRLCYLRCLL